MGRQKKKSCDKVTANEGSERETSNPRVESHHQGGEDLTASRNTQAESSEIDQDGKDLCDTNEKSPRKSWKDSYRRRLFGRARIPSRSPNRKDCRKQRVGQANGNNQNTQSMERLSRKEKFYSANSTRAESQPNQYKEVTAPVDSLDEEMRHGKVGRIRKSRKDFFNSTDTRRRRLSKSHFRMPRRCPLLRCLKTSKSSSREQKEKTNDNQRVLEISHKKDSTVKQSQECPISSRYEFQITGKSQCKLSEVKHTPKRRRQRKRIDRTKRSNNKKIFSLELQGKGKSKSKTDILNCCWNNTQESGDDQDSEASELVTPYETDGLISESKLKTEKRSNDESSSTCQDNYPEELNPLADDSVSDVMSTGKGHSISQSIGEKVSYADKIIDADNGKNIDRKQNDYPEHLNPFVEDETSEAMSTEPKEQTNSDDVSSSTCPNYPEELNPLADDSVSDVMSIVEGHTSQSIGEKVSNADKIIDADNGKSTDKNQDDYPEHLNPFAEDETSEAMSTEPKEQTNSDDESSSTCLNYPEELNPLADDSVSDVMPIGERHSTSQSIGEKVSNADQIIDVDNGKSIDKNQDDYPEHLNPFADNETSEAMSTEPKEQNNSQNVCLEKRMKTPKSRLRWKKLKVKVKRNFLSKNRKNDRERETFCQKTMSTKDKSDTSFISSADKDAKKYKILSDKDSRKCWSNWKQLKTKRFPVIDNSADNVVSKHNQTFDKDIQNKSVTSLTNSNVDVQERPHKKKKSWRSRFHVRRTKCGKTKKTDKLQSNSADQLTKFKPTDKRLFFKLRKQQKKATQEISVVLDEKAPENVEDETSVFRSKYLQFLNPLTDTTKERRIPKSKMGSRSDMKIKKRRWWKIGKPQKSYDKEENDPQKDQTTTDKMKSDNRDRTNQPKKKSILKKLKNACKTGRKKEQTFGPESPSIVCGQESENDRKSSTEVKDKLEVEAYKKENNTSSNKKTGLTENVDLNKNSKRRSPFTKLRKGWKNFNQWLEK